MARRISAAGLGSTGRAGAASKRVPPLVVQIADQLERDIIAGRYAGGEWVREQEIADRLGTSRGPVREALRLVELDGLIEMVPWRGARVVDMSAAEIDDLLEVVAALQGLVSRLAAAHAAPADIDRVEAVVTDMEATLDGGSMAQQLRLAFDGGALLREICGSNRAGSMLMKVGRLAFWQHRRLLDADLEWRRAAIAKWRALLAALRAGDGELADRAARAMVHHSKTFIMRALTTGESAVSVAELPDRMTTVAGR